MSFNFSTEQCPSTTYSATQNNAQTTKKSLWPIVTGTPNKWEQQGQRGNHFTMHTTIGPELFGPIVAAAHIFVYQVTSLTSLGVALSLSLFGISISTLFFLLPGERRITASNVFALAMALFAYFPAIYYSYSNTLPASNPIVFTTAICFTIHTLCQGIFWGGWRGHRTKYYTAAPEPSCTRQPDRPRRNRPALSVIGVLLLTLSIAVKTADLSFASLEDELAFVGVLLVTAGLALQRKAGVGTWVVAGAAFGVYAVTMYTGGGRLILGTLAVSVAVLLAAPGRSWLIKIACLFAMPLGLMALALDRSESVAALGQEETGFESVVAPLLTFGRVLELHESGNMDLAMGSTFWAAAVVMIPRALWPDKPIGLGAELTKIFRPDLVHVGHTEAILLPGEFFFNFSWIGLALAVPTIGIAIRILDRLLYKTALPMSLQGAFALIAVALLTGGVLDLVWTGTATFTGRAGPRLLILLLVYISVGFGAEASELRTAPRALRSASGPSKQ